MKKFLYLFIAVLILSCSKDDEPVVLSSENRITSFSLSIDGELIQGIIDQQEKTISFSTRGKNVSSLKPSVELSAKAQIVPSPEQPMDFRQTVSYTVYAEDGTPNVYRVLVDNRPISADNEIESFGFKLNGEVVEAVIDRETGIIRADVTVADINALTPVITLPEYASIDPPSEKQLDFTAPVTYTVTAENGDSRSYVVQVNEPVIESIILDFFVDQTFYVGAEAGIMGRFLMNEGEDPEVYLSDGAERFPLDKLEYIYSYSDTDTGIAYYAVTFVIPDDTPTNIYKVVLEKEGYRVEFEGFDVMRENAPDPQSLSQEVFDKDDVLTVYGENLTRGIVIPSDGSHYVLFNYGTSTKIDILVNAGRTEMNFTPQYYQYNLYPSYYGREPAETKITFFDEETFRVGRSIKATFK